MFDFVPNVTRVKPHRGQMCFFSCHLCLRINPLESIQADREKLEVDLTKHSLPAGLRKKVFEIAKAFSCGMGLFGVCFYLLSNTNT